MTITEENVRRVAETIDVDVSDPNVLRVLIESGSCDVQAAPGAGKTTVLAAKVAVLLDKPDQAGGICVLSHTNVAKNEITRRLSKMTAAGSTMQSPHFVGTIQAFVDAFLARPYLRSKKMPVDQIDDDAFVTIAASSYGRVPRNIVFALSKRTDWVDIHHYLEYEPRGDGIRAGIRRLPGVATPTYHALAELKAHLSSRGIFRYGDMYHFAHKYLDENPNAVEGLRTRFSFVLLDETQDCDETQRELLDRIFPPDKVVIQRFGDDNQAIFGREGAEGTAAFPRDPKLPLGESLRFGDFIAGLAASIAPNRQAVLGSSKRRGSDEAPHTLYLFDDASIECVIPEFANLAATYFGERRNMLIKAIGHKKTAGTSSLPRAIGDYRSAYVPEGGGGARLPSSFQSRIARARRIRSREGFPAAVEAVLGTVRSWIMRWAGPDYVFSVLRELRNTSPARGQLGRAIFLLLNGPLSEESYIAIIGNLRALLDPRLPPIPEHAERWAAWSAGQCVDLIGANGGEAAADSNAYVHSCNVTVKLDTIHGVKGESHNATLVLETHHYRHDVADVLPYLAKRTRLPAAPGVHLSAHLRRMFVAVSRPRDLLCIAAHVDHVPAEVILALEREGWAIKRLVSASEDASTATG